MNIKARQGVKKENMDARKEGRKEEERRRVGGVNMGIKGAVD